MHAFDLRNDKSSLPGASDVILFSRTSAVAVLTVNMESKERFFLLLVAKERENPDVAAKNAGCWSRSQVVAWQSAF